MNQFTVYKVVQERGAKKLRVWRYAAWAEDARDAVAAVKEENHGDVILPEEVGVRWFVSRTSGRTTHLGLVLMAREEWERAFDVGVHGEEVSS